jgi:hypothetical protein
MARYKVIDTNPRLLPVNLAAQLLPGAFEHAVDHLLDHAIDLSRFDARVRNDTTGAPAYRPVVLLKVVLCAYARGIVSSLSMARLCEDHVTFIALCGTRTPHFGLRQRPRLGHRPRLRRGTGGLRPAGTDRPRDVRHR